MEMRRGETPEKISQIRRPGEAPGWPTLPKQCTRAENLAPVKTSPNEPAGVYKAPRTPRVHAGKGMATPAEEIAEAGPGIG